MAEKRARGRPRGFNEPKTQSTIQSLDRALDILELLARSSGLTLTEIANDLDQSPATAYRVLMTLEKRGVVEADANTQTWHIGPTAFRLGSAFLRRTGLVERSRPVMRSLMEATGETANLGIARENSILFVSQVETNETIRAFFPPGTRSPFHASGIGKALLSQYSDQQIQKILRNSSLERFTPQTITTQEGLLEELARIRAQGFSFDDEERTSGMRCIAAPIIDASGEAIAGISVSGPTSRMTKDQIAQIGELVRNAAAELSAGLGAFSG